MQVSISPIAAVRRAQKNVRKTSPLRSRLVFPLLLIAAISNGCDFLKIQEESTTPTAAPPPVVETKAPEPPPKPPEPKPEPPEKVAERAIEQFYKLAPGQITDAHLQSLASIYEPAKAQIEKLDLQDSVITDNAFNSINQFKNLKSLVFSRTRVSRPALENLVSLKNLEMLDLTKLPVDNELVSRLTDLSGIKYLSFCETMIDDDALLLVDKFPNLETLDVSRNPGITGGGLRGAESLKHLTRLSIHTTGLVDQAIPIIVNYPLVHLDIGACPALTDQGVSKLAAMKDLEWLDVSQNPNLTSLSISKFARLKKLYFLNLHKIPRFDDRGLKFFQQTKTLKFINVSETAVTDRGKAALLKALPDLQFTNPR